jgi:hypothetical protein
MDSKEIRAMKYNPNATWKQYFNLLQEITARMAEQAERTPAPETAGAHVSEVRSNPGNENGAWCEICCATLVCPSCGNHRSEPAAPPSDAVTRDVLEKVVKMLGPCDCSMCYERVTAALRTFAEALEAEKQHIYSSGLFTSPEYQVVKEFDRRAIANLLGPEVKP